MANPCGTRTPCPDSFWNISPSDAFFPPTSGTSSMPNSSKKRTYLDVLMTCPLFSLVTRQVVGSIEPGPHVMQRRTRPVSLPGNRGTNKFTPGRSSTPMAACISGSATNANLPQRQARCQGRRSLESAGEPEVPGTMPLRFLVQSVSRCSAGSGANPRTDRENEQDCRKDATGDS